MIDLVKGAFAIPAFAGKPTDGDDGHIREGHGALYQRVGQLRLIHGTGLPPGGVAGRHVGAVEGIRFLEYRHPVGVGVHTVGEIVHIGHGHVAAAAAALHVVKGALAEQRYLRALGQGQQAARVLQKHHAFPGHILAQANVGGAGRDPCAVRAQGQVGVVVDASPLVHGVDSPFYISLIQSLFRIR